MYSSYPKTVFISLHFAEMWKTQLMGQKLMSIRFLKNASNYIIPAYWQRVELAVLSASYWLTHISTYKLPWSYFFVFLGLAKIWIFYLFFPPSHKIQKYLVSVMHGDELLETTYAGPSGASTQWYSEINMLSNHV